MTKWIKITSLLIVGLWSGFCLAGGALVAQETNLLEIRSVTVDGKNRPLPHGGTLNLGPFSQTVSFGFGKAPNANRELVRLRYKLEGYEDTWHEGDGEMYLVARFFDKSGDQIGQNMFKATGTSAGWNGDLKTSPLTHRRETLVVPPKASQLWITVSSAGPPATVGIFVVEGLIVSSLSSSNGSQVIFQFPFDRQQEGDVSTQVPVGWIRDGYRPSMAKIVELGQEPKARAFAILDEDTIGHAEWHMTKEYAPQVVPGDHLSIEWNEMFSMGVGEIPVANYEHLPPGKFKFHIMEVNAMGIPTGVEASLWVEVPQPFWKTSWFWSAVLIAGTAAMAGSWRYLIWQRMRREMLHLKNQQVLEQERLRIAHDIHDDLGARVTQISLLSAMAHDNPGSLEKARADFQQISKMSRDLISALYQTVWAVNPENDNLDALGNYLCQMVDQLCDRAQCRCRFHMQALPTDIQVSSQVRHNISLSVKEAVHNVIKHAQASEVIVRMTFTENLLAVAVEDNGCGFQMNNTPAGNGLTNMKTRLKELGGNCIIESKPGHGTTVQMYLVIKPLA
ncbi:MAG: Integral rane sensor signal transduction histidine kinase [Pedosphaera sp.]|nr:Integral rane sensor signal transduction histidine kinase [Pedosphaera sp.]